VAVAAVLLALLAVALILAVGSRDEPRPTEASPAQPAPSTSAGTADRERARAASQQAAAADLEERGQRAVERLAQRGLLLFCGGSKGRSNLFRPPYGAHNASADRQARALGMLQVLWSIDSRDSEGADWRGITKRVLSNVRSGSIVLLHENRGQTIRALKFHILPELARRRFKTVTIPELLALDPPSGEQLKQGSAGC